MTKPVSRREVLKRFGAAGAGAVLGARVASAQSEAIRVAGKAVEITLSSASAHTVRISVVALENGKPQPIPYDGSLVQQSWAKPSARLTTLSRARRVRCGDLVVKLVEGGREMSKPVDLATMPLYVRAGSIIPFGPVKQYTGEKVDAPLTLQVYPAADGAFTLYEDDGKTFNYRKGEWMKIQMTWNDNRRRLTMRRLPGSQMLAPPQRKIEVRVAPDKTTRTVIFTGRPLDVQC